jgi:hypothetical protein
MKRTIGLLGALVAAAAVPIVVPGVAGGASSTTCSGFLAPGTYDHLVVPARAACSGGGPVTILHGLFVQPGATFVLGNDRTANTGTIAGGVHAFNAASVQIHSARIFGGLHIRGGAGPFGGPAGITWNAIEDNRIDGGATVDGYNGFWFGFIRNTVTGSVNLNNNVVADEDGNEYVTNTIFGDLNCSGNSPAPQVGDSEGSPNVVTGQKTGQCANL